MKIIKLRTYISRPLVIALIAMTTSPVAFAQQSLRFGIHADPVISWFSTDNGEMTNKGARPGFNFGLSINKYFAENYSFSSGIKLISAGGRLITASASTFDLRDYSADPVLLEPGDAILYKIQYLAVPVGLKLQTNQIGYITFFTDVGLDPKVVLSGSADLARQGTGWQKAIEELRVFNISYHITAGIAYSLGGNTALVTGLSFDNNFLDITRDINSQPTDRVSHKLLSFRLGVDF
jgi:hypothetical protein